MRGPGAPPTGSRMNESWIIVCVALSVAIVSVLAYQLINRARLRSTEAKGIAIEVAEEVGSTAETIRRRRCVEDMEAGAERLVRGEALPELAEIASLWSLVACRAAVRSPVAMRGQLSTWVPELVLAADSVSDDLKRLSNAPPGQARPELLGELLIMSCAFLELCDRVVSEVGRLYPGVVISTGVPGEMEQIYWSTLAGSSIPSLIKAREVEAAIDVDMLHFARRAGGQDIPQSGAVQTFERS